MRGKIVYAGILAVTVYLNMLYHWELGNFVLAFEGMFLLLLLCNAGISWSGVSAEWKHTKLFVEEGGNTTKSDICQKSSVYSSM